MSDLPERAAGAPNTPETIGVPNAAQEVDALPKEVTSAGVSVHPTTIPVPQPVAKMGVQPASANIPMPAATVSLPLSDDDIAKGLHASITSSIRWLAEWCMRRLKQAHIGFKNIHGKIMRKNYA